jgi:quercetin dioxygenase-like cupin family protein
MATRRHEDIESSVLSFHRELVHDGVHVANIGLRKGEASTFHHHSETADTFYVMSGALTITLYVEAGREAPHYRSLCATPPRVERLVDGREVHRARLVAGDVFVIEPNVVHCASNMDDEPCRFLCIEGIGRYDFIALNP